MRYRWSRKPWGLLFLGFSRQHGAAVSRERELSTASDLVRSLLAARVARAESNVDRENALCAPALARSTHHSRGVDSGCEPSDRPHAPGGDSSRHRHWRLGLDRSSTKSSSRSIRSLRRRVGWGDLRMRSTCGRSRPGFSGGVVRNRDGRDARNSCHRPSRRPSDTASGIAAPFRRLRWK